MRASANDFATRRAIRDREKAKEAELAIGKEGKKGKRTEKKRGHEKNARR